VIARLMGLVTVSPARVHELMQREAVTVIDVNSRQSWDRAHVPGALSLDPITYHDRDLPQDRNALLVFYCSNSLCRKAPSAARRAKRMGYPNVLVMSAGISGWLNAGLPSESS
jgi:rhodanese-related sulfurtransferase